VAVIRTLAILLVIFGLLATSGRSKVHAQEPGEAVVQGSLPERGGVALIAVPEGATVGALLNGLHSGGCDATLLAIARGGAFQLYAPEAPAFANAAFPTLLPAGTLAVVRCSELTSDVPTSDVPDADLLRLVTKEVALPSDFVPDGLALLPSELVMPGGGSLYLTEEATEALEEMLDAASSAGHEIAVRSAYRSYREQVFTYEYWVDVLGETEANRRSAPPGHSEHQLGVVVDLASASVGWELIPEFGTTPEGEWLKQHAWRFGFVESYPEDAEAITGYVYEPWHLRYIGQTHADWLRSTDLTLTEYLARIRAGLG
jgi:D-alanyl-D-alanine carboxypeptidase